MTAVAIRHPKRGKAHRENGSLTGCYLWASTERMSQHIPLADVAPEDRCRRCWPTTPTPDVAQAAPKETR